MGPARRRSLFVLVAALFAAGLWGCGEGGGTPGQKVDRALDRTGDALKDAGEAIKPK